MTMSDDRLEELLGTIRETYNRPPETPRDEMWARIEARLRPSEAGVVDLLRERARRKWLTPASAGWAAAAAVVLAVGIGIGRITALPTVGGVEAAVDEPAASTLAYAAAEHLERSELFLRMVRDDARNGRVDDVTRDWAEGLLAETRMLIDADEGARDPTLEELLEDLELVLAQIVGAGGSEGMERGRTQSELRLALRGLEEREIIPRIGAVTPVTPVGLAGQ